MNFEKITQLRYVILDWCFTDKEHKYTYEELTEKMAEALFGDSSFSIIPNQVADDIHDIQNYRYFDTQIISYPMEEGKECCYRYEDPSYHMFYKTLSFEGLKKICSTLRPLYISLKKYEEYKDSSELTFIHEIIRNLEERLGTTGKNPCKEEMYSLQGLEHLPNLVDAIINQQPLKIHYRTFNQREFEVTCHPYYIKLHNNRWFLLAWTKQYNQLGYYTLERIVTFNKEAVPYICINKKYYLGEYFDALTVLE